MVTTPMLYFATHHLGTGSGVMVTGSHNPPDYNGLKMMLAGETLSGDDIQALRQRLETGDICSGRRQLPQRGQSANAYLERVTGDVKLKRKMRIAVDCGNGVPGAFAPGAVPHARLRSARNCSAKSTARSPIIIPIRRNRRTCRT